MSGILFYNEMKIPLYLAKMNNKLKAKKEST
jgi:hypothetical protein